MWVRAHPLDCDEDACLGGSGTTVKKYHKHSSPAGSEDPHGMRDLNIFARDWGAARGRHHRSPRFSARAWVVEGVALTTVETVPYYEWRYRAVVYCT